MTAVRWKGHRKFALARLQKLHPFSRHQSAKPNRAWSVGEAMPSTDGSPMAEQILDRPAEARRAASEIGNGLAPSAAGLIPGWRCLPGAVIRAHGEEGPVDLAVLHPARGVALIAFLDEGQEASPEEARNALRTMLRDEGLQRRFPGELPIVALPVPRAAHAQLAVTVEHAFSGMPAPTLPPGWVDWLAERLAAARPSTAPTASRLLAPRRDEPMPEKVVSALLLTSAAEPAMTAAVPRLLAPQRDDPMPEKAAGGIVLAGPARVETTPEKATLDNEAAMPPETAPQHNWLDWGATLGFALGMVAALIAGLTALLRNGRLF